MTAAGNEAETSTSSARRLLLFNNIQAWFSLVLCELLNVMVVCFPVVVGLLFVLVFP